MSNPLLNKNCQTSCILKYNETDIVLKRYCWLPIDEIIHIDLSTITQTYLATVSVCVYTHTQTHTHTETHVC